MAQRNLKVGAIKDISGEVNIAAGDIIKNIKTIHQRALTAAEAAAHASKLESKLLAQGIATLVQNLSAQASEGTESDSPYKGLLPYSLNEAEIFYGRNKAKKDLLAHIKQSPLTVLHAESGAGKSSLLQAGIAAQLIANGHLAVYLRPYHADPVEFIKRMFLPELSQAPALAGASLREFLRQVCSVLGAKSSLYLLLDQFEEFFQLKKEERQPFLDSLADCLHDPSLKVRWVLALRKEALSDLAELESFGITQFKNTYRLDRLSRAEAQEAMVEPARQHDIVFEPALIEHILDTLTANDEIRPTHLQLVCSALTDDSAEVKTLTLAYYTQHEGGTEGILRDYLKRQLEDLPASEQILAWKVLRALISADRQRTLKTYAQLIQELKTSGVSKKQIETILSRLVERRLLFTQIQPATEEMFELAHDYLIKEIELDPQEQALKAAQELLDQETRTYERHKTLITAERLAVIDPYQNELHFSAEARALLSESQKAVQEEQRARERRRNITLGISSAVAIAMSLLAVWGLRSSQEATKQAAAANSASTQAVAQQATAQANAEEAQKQAEIARAGELAAQSNEIREQNFQISLLLGIEAFDSKNTARSRGALFDVTNTNPQLLRFLTGHAGDMSSIAFSPDGETLASGSDDGTIILWDVSTALNTSVVTRQPIGQPLTGHTAMVYSIAFSPDGETLASGSGDGTIILWNVATQQRISQSLKGHRHFVLSIAFSPDGKYLASGGDDGTIIFWDVGTLQPIGSPFIAHTHAVSSIAISPDGGVLASGGGDGAIVLWDTVTRELIGRPLRSNATYILSVVFSPDGKTLASSGNDGINLWDVATALNTSVVTRQPISQPLGAGSANSVVFSRDGMMFAAGYDDGSVILWDFLSKERVQSFRGHSSSVSSVAFSPDDRTLASSGNDGVILWAIDQRQPIGQLLTESAGSISQIAFSPDGKILASGSGQNMIIFWDVASHKPIGQLLMKGLFSVSSIAFSPDSRMLATSNGANGGDNTILLWDVKTQQAIGPPLMGHTDWVSTVAFSPDGKILASGSGDHTVILWDVVAHKPVGQLLTGYTFSVSSVAFSPDGKTFISSGDDTIIFWDLETRQPVGQPLTVNIHGVVRVAFSPDGKTLATVDADGTIILWDLETRQPIGQPLTGHASSISSVAFNPLDDQMLASGGSDGTITLWDLTVHQPIGQIFTGKKLAVTSVTSLAFSPNGKMLASGNRYDKLFLWKVSPQYWIEQSCQRAGRNFTRAEWERYFPNETYRKTCEQWPLEAEVTATPTPAT